ncbi:DUF6572 domain-containing protein [Sedimenticola thiotaurini]|uniref:Uncharacterized protein n=1 Tax=Sedimenticola thiotaurini TaxID=1543721 RepID=A0A0F7K3U0_9GAMM|nr:DUF6572 domain-containing protein [Sedimenticola thiotaurini]AKH21598.1 hypothetical protein AAY24_15915 [Sedimenticola thiotaurini]
MTIEQENVIDIIANNEEKGYVSLVISDHLEWDEKNEKLLILQNKINAYITFAESGQIYEEYPSAKGLNVNIQLTCMHPPNEEGTKFLGLVQPVIEEAGFNFNWEVSG